MLENENLNEPQKPQLNIAAVSRSALNGFTPDIRISDELEDLTRRYIPEQIKKMWDDCIPKTSKIKGVPVIIGIPK